ncbi:MAG: polysaccharide pyruvyl transferase family protein [Bacteroidales bacterium]|nr:polysaccharide pyruvyl transferase family protein [Bacteroidales bacterium]
MKKVIIFTQPLRINFGGILQAYALQKTVRDLGFDVITDNPTLRRRSLIVILKDYAARFFYGVLKNDDKYKPFFKKRVKKEDYEVISRNPQRFIKENIRTVDFFCGKRHPDKNKIKQYDIYIAGSDQVWRRRYADVKRYFFDFLDDDSIDRFSYAASFGVDNLNEYSLEEKQICKQLVKKFKAVSVRESSAIDILKKEFDQEAVLVLDPTILLTKEDYLKLCSNFLESSSTNVESSFRKLKQSSTNEEKGDKKRMFCYVLDQTEQTGTLTKKLATYLNMDTEGVGVKENVDSKAEDITQYILPDVEKWIKTFDDCDYIFTDSFHGTVFSIIFNKPFVVIINKIRGGSRLYSLLSLLGLEDRIIYSEDDLTEEFLNHLYDIDYEKVNKKKEELKEFSLNYLKRALGVEE